jgi:hypothetical protein
VFLFIWEALLPMGRDLYAQMEGKEKARQKKAPHEPNTAGLDRYDSRNKEISFCANSHSSSGCEQKEAAAARDRKEAQRGASRSWASHTAKRTEAAG